MFLPQPPSPSPKLEKSISKARFGISVLANHDPPKPLSTSIHSSVTTTLRSRRSDLHTQSPYQQQYGNRDGTGYPRKAVLNDAPSSRLPTLQMNCAKEGDSLRHFISLDVPKKKTGKLIRCGVELLKKWDLRTGYAPSLELWLTTAQSRKIVTTTLNCFKKIKGTPCLLLVTKTVRRY